ncbi:VOC family protein [Oxalobacteraceae bacterium]|nr:VOC family protein [Oxalobacteraceae bacterium]
MLSHVYIGIRDFPAALRFYSGLMEEIGCRLKFSDAGKPWAGWMPADAPRPLLVIGAPYNGDAASVGNGQMVALNAPTRAAVDAAHARALALGGGCEGKPGLRPDYHPHYYGAYFRDPDGNKLCVVCHDAV